MHTGTCQHVDPVSNGTPAHNRAIPACSKCADPFGRPAPTQNRLVNRPFEGLSVLYDNSTKSGLMAEFPRFTIEGQR